MLNSTMLNWFIIKNGQSLLQTGASITKWEIFMTKWGRYYKVGQVLVQFVKLDIITKCDKSYEKVGQVYITKWGSRY